MLDSTGVTSADCRIKECKTVILSSLDSVYNISFSVNATLSSGGIFTSEIISIYIDCYDVVTLT